MILELNSKPKKLVIQRHTNSNNWMTIAVMYKEDVVEKFTDAVEELTNNLVTNPYYKELDLEHLIENTIYHITLEKMGEFSSANKFKNLIYSGSPPPINTSV